MDGTDGETAAQTETTKGLSLEPDVHVLYHMYPHCLSGMGELWTLRGFQFFLGCQLGGTPLVPKLCLCGPLLAAIVLSGGTTTLFSWICVAPFPALPGAHSQLRQPEGEACSLEGILEEAVLELDLR